MHRRAGRVIIVHGQSVLMMQGGDPARPEAGEWLFTVGGGCEAGETTSQAARREAFEETGITLPADLGPVVLTRTVEFLFNGSSVTQSEDYYLWHLEEALTPDSSGWTPEEREIISTLRWWSASELRETHLPVYPETLIDLLESLSTG